MIIINMHTTNDNAIFEIQSNLLLKILSPRTPRPIILKHIFKNYDTIIKLIEKVEEIRSKKFHA